MKKEVSIPQAVIPSCNKDLPQKEQQEFSQVSIPQAVIPSCNSVLGNALQDWAKNSDLDHRPLFRLFFTQIAVDIVFIFARNMLITRMLPVFLLSTTLLDHRFSNFPLL